MNEQRRSELPLSEREQSKRHARQTYAERQRYFEELTRERGNWGRRSNAARVRGGQPAMPTSPST